jgi:hypothetical protein
LDALDESVGSAIAGLACDLMSVGFLLARSVVVCLLVVGGWVLGMVSSVRLGCCEGWLFGRVVVYRGPVKICVGGEYGWE